MPILVCKNCKGKTNTTVCDWLPGVKNGDFAKGLAQRCFVRWENGKPVEGCAYDQANEHQRRSADIALNATPSSDSEQINLLEPSD